MNKKEKLEELQEFLAFHVTEGSRCFAAVFDISNEPPSYHFLVTKDAKAASPSTLYMR